MNMDKDFNNKLNKIRLKELESIKTLKFVRFLNVLLIINICFFIFNIIRFHNDEVIAVLLVFLGYYIFVLFQEAYNLVKIRDEKVKLLDDYDKNYSGNNIFMRFKDIVIQKGKDFNINDYVYNVVELDSNNDEIIREDLNGRTFIKFNNVDKDKVGTYKVVYCFYYNKIEYEFDRIVYVKEDIDSSK